MRFTHVLLCSVCISLVACGTRSLTPSGAFDQSDKHIQQSPDAAKHDSSSIPQTSKHAVVLPPPKPATKVDTFSVIFSNDIAVRDVLFTLGREAKINIDIKDGSDPAMGKMITLNAINQTLPQILERLAKQSDIRYEFDASGNLLVMPDRPFLKTYKIDFLNMSREAKSTNSTSSQIKSGSAGGNSASTSVISETKNNLMESLIDNVTKMLIEEDRLRVKSAIQQETLNKARAKEDVTTDSPSANSASTSSNQSIQNQRSDTLKGMYVEAATSVFANKETGVLLVRATGRQHEKVQEFIDAVMRSAKRQVLIEATIVEVQLSDNYKQGIDWSRALLGAKGFALSQAGTAGIASTTGALAVSYINPTSKFGNIAASVQLLEKFGNVKVLSSPKLSVMNNQTASLKVANSKVYFTMTVTPATFTGGVMSSPPTYTTTNDSVSVGLTMTVTPQISEGDTVTINVRPSISSLIGLGAKDPNPALANPCGTGVTSCTIPGVENRIPEIQTREMESIIKVENGQTAVMGGLIREEINKNTSEVPFLARIPLLGNLFQNRDDTTTKTELVIFLRPVVIKDASVNGDFAEFRNNLPTPEFFNETAQGSKP
jgi:general secretion pathway protein D